MAETRTIARPYAEAVFKVARDKNNLASWAAMLGLAASMASDVQIRALIGDPNVPSKRLGELLIAICGDRLNDEGRNFILLLAGMSVLQATLTLPGIAGMVLSLGMAVDANVLINERIREEIRAGRGPARALEEGYRAARGTILDSNLTVIISAVFLYIFGSGTVKGFAITLIIGTAVSMFTAVIVARLLTSIWFMRTRPKSIPI